MNKMKKLFVSFLTICMLLGLMASNVMAADYTWTVTLYTGNQGTLADGSTKVIMTGFNNANNTITFNIGDIALKDSKYYIKGVRYSARDNNTTPSELSFRVNGDTDFVVSYGVLANRVSYTVNYVDANGTALATSRTYYGDIGDTPVVAYQYIEGYVPQATAMTGTLSANEAENVFTFTYTPGNAGEIVNTTTTVTTVGTADATGTAAAATPAAGTTAAAGAAAAATPTETAAAADANAAADAALNGGDAANTVTNTDEATPQALQNLDEETPTANIDASDSNGPSPLVVGGIVAGVSILALIALFIGLKKMKAKK